MNKYKISGEYFFFNIKRGFTSTVSINDSMAIVNRKSKTELHSTEIGDVAGIYIENQKLVIDNHSNDKKKNQSDVDNTIPTKLATNLDGRIENIATFYQNTGKSPRLIFSSRTGENQTSLFIAVREFVVGQINTNPENLYSGCEGIYKGVVFSFLPDNIIEQLRKEKYKLNPKIRSQIRLYQHTSDDLVLSVEKF